MYSVKIKSLIRRSFSLLKYLPRVLRNKIIRAQVQFPKVTRTSDEFTIKIAESKTEFEQAFKILHDSYVDARLMKKESSGLRITKYHTLPSTTIIVVKKAEEVVGTVSLILDSPMGLPIDEVADLTPYRATQSRLCEVSSLAIKKDSGLRRGKIFAPLTVFIHKYSVNIAGVDGLVCVVTERAKLFYEGVLLFAPLPINGSSYNYVDTPTFSPMFCDIGSGLFPRMEKTYRKAKSDKSYHKLLLEKIPIYKEIFPEHKGGQAGGTQVSRDYLENLVKKSELLLKSLDEFSLSTLQSIYLDPDLYSSFSHMKPPTKLERENQRFAVHITGALTGDSMTRPIYFSAQEVSWEGLAIHCDEEPVGRNFQLILEDSIGSIHELEVELCWEKPEIKKYGFKVVQTELSWYRLNRELESFYYPDLVKTNKKHLGNKKMRLTQRLA